ncbi:MAG: hypothetical protein K0U76_02785 [Actinomycetia bacterium]|nr:hypothetical protein [Actinomycetes bacterium]MCH9761860.1 hypothetical protein [Actinomycetes bacterium]
MSRRTGLSWAPTSLPTMRKQWCEVLGEGLDRLAGQADPTTLAAARADLDGIAASTLFWVARDMTDLAVRAAASLPEWSPAAAIPTEFGLLAWAKPSGVFAWPAPDGSGATVTMPVDALCWGIRDGKVGVSCAFRTDRVADQLNPGLARLPLLAHPMGVWNLEEPVAPPRRRRGLPAERVGIGLAVDGIAIGERVPAAAQRERPDGRR